MIDNFEKLIRVDRNGTKYYSSNVCRKCGGTGYILGYEHIDGARCWKCNATGKEKPYQWKEYTPEYSKVLETRRRAKLIAKSHDENLKNFKKWGFSEDGKTYIVLGDTFSIKDSLKSSGAKFNDSLGWHFAEPNDQFDLLEISIAEVAEQTDLGMWQLLPYVELFPMIKKRKEDLLPKSNSEYIGTIGDTITTTATLTAVHTFATHFSYYGETVYVLKFTDKLGNILVWKTSSPPDFEEGKVYELRGKIKDHSEYKGEKQTVLQRCKIK